MTNLVVRTPAELRAILVEHGVAAEDMDRMVREISIDLKNPGEVFLPKEDGGLTVVTNHALVERRKKDEKRRRRY